MAVHLNVRGGSRRRQTSGAVYVPSGKGGGMNRDGEDVSNVQITCRCGTQIPATETVDRVVCDCGRRFAVTVTAIKGPGGGSSRPST